MSQDKKIMHRGVLRLWKLFSVVLVDAGNVIQCNNVEYVTCCVTCPYLSNPYLEIPGCLRSVVPAIKRKMTCLSQGFSFTSVC